MLTTLLSDGESSRLSKSIVDKQQKALQVMAFPFALEDPGLVLTFGLVNMESLYPTWKLPLKLRLTR
jgi:predicted Zn-dependent peptidase